LKEHEVSQWNGGAATVAAVKEGGGKEDGWRIEPRRRTNVWVDGEGLE